MNRRRKIEITVAIALLAVAAVLLVSYAVMLQSNNYPAHFSIGNGTPPNFQFGLFYQNGSEVTAFNFSGLATDSAYVYNYTLKQKSSLDLNVYIKWAYDCMPIQQVNMVAAFNGTTWNPGTTAEVALLWHALQNVPIVFTVMTGSTDNYSWDCNIALTVSTSP